MLVLGRSEPGTWVRELDVGENMGGLGGTWLAPGRLCEVEESDVGAWCGRILKVNQSIHPKQVQLLCGNIWELLNSQPPGRSGTDGNHSQINSSHLFCFWDKTSDTFLGHFLRLNYGQHNWRWRTDKLWTTFFLVCFTFSRFCLDWDGFQSHLCRLNPSWIETLRLVLEVAVAAAQEMKNPAKSPPKCPVHPTLAGISRQIAQQLHRACTTLLQEPVSREASKSKFSGVQELKHLDFVCSVF